MSDVRRESLGTLGSSEMNGVESGVDSLRVCMGPEGVSRTRMSVYA